MHETESHHPPAGPIPSPVRSEGQSQAVAAGRGGLPGRTTWSQRMVLLVAASLVLVPLGYYGLRREVAKWHLAAARQSIYTDNLDAALKATQSSIGWHPAYLRAWNEQVAIHLARGDAKSAMAPAERALELARREHAQLNSPQTRAALAQALNACAYVHALAQSQLPRALELAEEMFVVIGHEEIPDFRDTRGYLHFLLGNIEAAHDDVEAAVMARERNYRGMLQSARDQARMFVETSRLEYEARQVTHSMAVLYQHRGLVRQAMGDESAAERDFERAAEMGFDPEQGVW